MLDLCDRGPGASNWFSSSPSIRVQAPFVSAQVSILLSDKPTLLAQSETSSGSATARHTTLSMPASFSSSICSTKQNFWMKCTVGANWSRDPIRLVVGACLHCLCSLAHAFLSKLDPCLAHQRQQLENPATYTTRLKRWKYGISRKLELPYPKYLFDGCFAPWPKQAQVFSQRQVSASVQADMAHAFAKV